MNVHSLSSRTPITTQSALKCVARPMSNSVHPSGADSVALQIAKSRTPRSKCTSRKLRFPVCPGSSLGSEPEAHKSIGYSYVCPSYSQDAAVFCFCLNELNVEGSWLDVEGWMQRPHELDSN